MLDRIERRYYDMSLSTGYFTERELMGKKPYAITARTRRRKKFKIKRSYYFLDVIDGRIEEPFKRTKNYKRHMLEIDHRAFTRNVCTPFGRNCPKKRC